MKTKVFVALSCVAVAATARAGGYLRTLSNIMPSSQSDVQNMVYTRSALRSVAQDGNGLIFTVDFADQWSSIKSAYPNPADWSAYDGVMLTLTNSGTSTAHILFRIETLPNSHDMAATCNGEMSIESDSKRNFVMWFTQSPGQYGFRQAIADVSEPYEFVPTNNFNATMNSVYAWRIADYSSVPQTVTVNRMTLVNKRTSLDGLVDAYGQYSILEWNGKAHDDSDLRAQVSAEQAQLLNWPIVAELQGTTSLPNMGATGQWRLSRTASGNSCFVHPNGNAFWSIGVSSVGGTTATRIDNRSGLFQLLPPTNQDIGSPYSRQQLGNGSWVNTVDFHIANLEKKFGATWRTDSKNLTLQRLPKWGFNTIGGFSSSEYCDGSMPFVKVLRTDGFPTRVSVPFAPWGLPPDVFDPNWVSWLTASLGTQIAAINNNPNLIGVCVDNEIGWGTRDSATTKYQISIAALNADPAQPCKAAMIGSLQYKYGTIDALNAAWQTNYSSWDSLNQLNGYGTPPINDAMAFDLSRYLRWFATRYYYGIMYALRRDNFSGLYLGSRNVYDWTPNEVWESCERFIDAHSVNLYINLDEAFPYLATLQKPVLITEFSYSGIDRGQSTFGFPIEEGTQRERAAALEGHIYRALSTPNIVGIHFFEYVDEPSSGRFFDNATWNNGIVDITDTPYLDLTREFANIGKQIYLRHP